MFSPSIVDFAFLSFSFAAKRPGRWKTRTFIVLYRAFELVTEFNRLTSNIRRNKVNLMKSDWFVETFDLPFIIFIDPRHKRCFLIPNWYGKVQVGFLIGGCVVKRPARDDRENIVRDSPAHYQDSSGVSELLSSSWRYIGASKKGTKNLTHESFWRGRAKKKN